MKETNTFIFHTIFMLVIANLIQLLFGYVNTQTIYFDFNIKYEILYVFISLLWGVSVYIEFSEELSRALGVIIRMILHFIFGYFGILVGMITFYGIDIVKTRIVLMTIIYIVSFIVFGYITGSLVKKMSYKNIN